MTKATHTPGKWEAWQAPTGEWTVRAIYLDEQGRRCTAWPAVCNAGGQDNQANARLIAAAPDMLDALRAAANSAGFQYMIAETRDLIDAAIVRAEGSQP